jgi:hypothetical protein
VSRTTSQLVGGIIDVDTGDDLTPFIEVANLLVTDVCTSSSYSDSRLEHIERYLAAHFYAIRVPRISSGTIRGGTTEKYEQISTDLGFSVTKYGQTAKVLDYKGNLAAIDNANKKGTSVAIGGGGKTGVTWLGSDPNATP